MHDFSDNKAEFGQSYTGKEYIVYNYTSFATRSDMEDYNNVLSTIMQETADQH